MHKGQVPRLRKLQFSGNPISWPPITILSKGLDTILSFLRGAYMEQLSQGVVDIIPKANDYGMYSITQKQGNLIDQHLKKSTQWFLTSSKSVQKMEKIA